MLDGYKILAVTHKQTPLHAIGKYMIASPDEQAVKNTLQSLKVRFGIDEIVYLSTCNRSTYILYTEERLPDTFTEDFFLFINPENNATSIQKHVEVYEGGEAAEHLFRVAASLDSLVIGEREVLRQIREAYDRCFDWGLTGDYLRIIVQNAVVAAKEVYTTTKLCEKSVSVVSLAYKEMQKSKLPKSARILMVGAGQTNELVSKFLLKGGYTNVTVFNRSLDKAQLISSKFNGKAYTLEQLDSYTGGFDCLIVCTGATSAIIRKELYSKLLGSETDQKVVIDLSIPNNVGKDVVNGGFNLNYIEIEGIKTIAKKNHALRRREVVNATELLERHFLAFQEMVQNRRIEKALHRIPGEVKAIRERAMTQVFQKEVAELDDSTRQLLDRMMNYMEKKCIGIPIRVAKEAFAQSTP